MDIENIVIANHHINLIRALHDYHIRHYIWEVAKVLIPVFITGMITVVVMRSNENKNRKRWLHDGHIKRKTELEIEIRKYLLEIKTNCSYEYYILDDWYENQEIADSDLIYSFNNSFAELTSHLPDKKIFALMDEYACYVPKINSTFSEFKVLFNKFSELKPLQEGEVTVLGEVARNPEYFDEMITTYLSFLSLIETILKKLSIKVVK